MTERLFFDGRPARGFALGGPTDVVCVVPLKQYEAALLAGGGAVASGLLGSKLGAHFKHPTVGAIAGMVVGGAVLAPFLNYPPGSGRTATEAKTLPPIDERGFMSDDPDVCVRPDIGESVALGAAAPVVAGVIGALVGRHFFKRASAGAITGGAIASALVGPMISRGIFGEKTAADAQNLLPIGG